MRDPCCPGWSQSWTFRLAAAIWAAATGDSPTLFWSSLESTSGCCEGNTDPEGDVLGLVSGDSLSVVVGAGDSCSEGGGWRGSLDDEGVEIEEKEVEIEVGGEERGLLLPSSGGGLEEDDDNDKCDDKGGVGMG